MEETAEVRLVGVTHLGGDKTEALAPDPLLEALRLPSLKMVFAPGHPLKAWHPHPTSPSLGPLKAWNPHPMSLSLSSPGGMASSPEETESRSPGHCWPRACTVQ